MSIYKRPLVLTILDGWGYRAETKNNAIALAKKPTYDKLLREYPNTLIQASDHFVGLPDGQMGNSEVGHLNIGAGRVVQMDITRIDAAIASGEFVKIPAIVKAMKQAREGGRQLHLFGLCSDGGVHSQLEHLYALLRTAREYGLTRVFVHCFMDGRDTPPASGATYIAQLEQKMREYGVGKIASVHGRYYAMDRDKRWDRIQRAYEVVAGTGEARAADPVAYIRSQYEIGITDEFLPPVSICAEGEQPVRIADGDAVIFFNFRPDRARQLTHALLDKDFPQFERSRVPHGLTYVTMTEYESGLPVRIAYPPEEIRNCLAEVVSKSGGHQFHVAETEKYAHVTYFINGGQEPPFEGEDRKLIQSPKTATYDTVPAMSAVAVTDEVVERIEAGQETLIIVNYANPDMVGHTGDFVATVQACETVDVCLHRVVTAALEAGGAVLITADHGNAEHKIDPVTNDPLTAHTTNPVPVVLIGSSATALRDGGGLCDVAPTVLRVLGFPQPPEMTGHSLISA